MGNGVNGSINSVKTYSPGNYELPWLLTGVKWGGAVGSGVTLKYSFVTNPFAITYDTGVLDGFTSKQQAGAKSVQAAWAAVADIKFTLVSDSTSGAGDIRWLNASGPDTAFAYYPASSALGGDIWMGQKYSQFKAPATGNYGYLTFLHELGHALGLQHPHEVKNAPVLHDQLKYSIMSYRDFAGDSLNGYTTAFFPTTPMLDDVKAIQTLYGKNMSFNAGNTVYKWDANKSIFQTIWDAAGVDTIDASNQLKGVIINLASGTFSTIGKAFFNGNTTVNDCLAIAYDCTIENATGSALADTLYGNAVGNNLSGGSGNDRLLAYAGNDVLNGGAGIDTLTGGTGNDTYYLDNAKDVVSETSALTSEIDTVVAGFSYTLGANIERLTLTGTAAINGYGNALNNTLVGNGAANTLSGGAGNDVLTGQAGADTMVGGTGADTYVVENAGDVVKETTTLSTEIDTVISSVTYTLGANLECLTLSGSAAVNGTGNGLANTLAGNTGANVLQGGGGSDVLLGGAGADTLVGGDGADRFVLDSLIGADRIQDFASRVDRIILDNSSLGGLGDNDAVIDGAAVTAVTGFSRSAELVLFSRVIGGAITNDSAAAIIGNAGSSFAVGDERIFVVKNGLQSGVYLFEEKYGDAAVAANELQLLGVLNTASTQIGDYLFQA